MVPDVATAPVSELGPRIGADPLFPEGVNVGFMAVHDRHQIDLRVFERGAGETPPAAAAPVPPRWRVSSATC